MAIKFEPPKVKLDSDNPFYKKKKQREANVKAQQRKYALPGTVQRAEGQYTRKASKRIYPDFAKVNNVHPMMLDFWDYLRNPTLGTRVKTNLVATGAAKLIWQWVYKRVPYPLGFKGHPFSGKRSRPKKLKGSILPQTYTPCTCGRFVEDECQKRLLEHYELHPSVKEKQKDGEEQADTGIIPKV